MGFEICSSKGTAYELSQQRDTTIRSKAVLHEWEVHCLEDSRVLFSDGEADSCSEGPRPWKKAAQDQGFTYNKMSCNIEVRSADAG